MNLLDLAIKVTCDDQATDKIENISGKMENRLGSAAKAGVVAIGAAITAVAAAAVKFGKQALDSYANYEQLVGGVDKLYGEASGKLQAYAAQAYQTSEMSANQYMEQATSFSAALVNSLGGDVNKAAEQTDVAMRAMSDNVNVFGSNMQDVQNAFQGFAKQNYTMLDNLKLGYGGTKEEMERLISDANEYAAANGEAANLSIDSFSDIVTAIELIQEKQNIAGTTAREAATTIEGSVNQAKAAWENFVTGFGNENANMSELTMQLVDSIATAASNIVPRVEQIVSSMSQTVVEHGPEMLTNALDFVGEMANGAMQMAPQVLAAIGTVVMSLLQYVVNHAPQMLSSALQFISMLGNGIVQNGPSILYQLASLVGQLIGSVLGAIGDMLQAGFELMVGLGGGMDNFDLGAAISGIVDIILNAFAGAGSWLLDAGWNILQGLWNGISGGLGWLGDQLAGIGDFIVSHKGPPSYDAVMLEDNGGLIMGSLVSGIRGGIPALEKELDRINGIVDGGMSASVSVSSSTKRGNGRNEVVEWLAANLPRIIAECTPVMGEGDFGRNVRKAVAYA